MREDVVERIALGVVDAERKRRSKPLGASIVELDGLVLAFAGVPDPSVNTVFVGREPVDPGNALARARELFSERGLELGVSLAAGRHPALEGAIREAGLRRLFAQPAMAARIDTLPIVSPPVGVEIRAVTDSGSARALGLVDVEAFGDSIEVVEGFYEPGSFGVEGAKSFVAWEQDRPVGGGSAYVHDGAVGLYGIGVVEGARRRGVGSALTVHGARSFPGADLAWLHATEIARTMYEQLGFRAVCEWEVWVERRP